MNAVTFLALVITTGYAVRVEVTLNGTFTCSYNEDPVTVDLWEWDLFDDDKLDSQTVFVGANFSLSGVEDEWFDIQPYMTIIHRCNSCRVKIRCDKT
uniref:Transthyretin-like family protein n=1 Tax=Haemonchus contortus TaxID=6289 RepID=A0A7I4Z2R1_HAECO